MGTGAGVVLICQLGAGAGASADGNVEPHVRVWRKGNRKAD